MKLRLKNISKRYEDEVILDDVTFDVAEGELFSIIGVSGAGKTTLMKIVSGLVEPDVGRVIIDDEDCTGRSAEERSIPYVFQAPLLFPHMTVFENIAFGLSIRKFERKEIEEKVNRLLHLLKIEALANRMPSEISGGQQQRVAIARALATEPPLILMDEPFSSLDPELRLQMGALLRMIKEELKVTIVFVTHDRNESLALSDRIALLEDGRIIQIDTPEAIYFKPVNRRAARFMGTGNFIGGTVKKGVFYSDVCEINAKGEPDGETQLFLRPHQIKISKEREDYLVIGKEKLGKEQMLTLTRDKVEIVVETFSDLLIQEGDRIGIEIATDDCHFIGMKD